MKHGFSILSCIIMAAAIGCSGGDREYVGPAIGTTTFIEGDGTLYGLACDGCTDSVVVMLPSDCSDPVTYDIVDARRQGRVAGRLEVGDWMCLMRDDNDTLRARSVINLDELKGTWVQSVMPVRKSDDGIYDRRDTLLYAVSDSAIDAMMHPYEIGFTLKRHYTAEPVGMRTRNADTDNAPVVFPEPKMYSGWHVFNGRIVLVEDSVALADTVESDGFLHNDTVDVLLLTRDTLRLRYQDGREEGYSRR